MARIEEVIGLYGAALARVAASYEADRALREDLLQEMLLAIHRSLPALRDPERLGPFVFRVAHNRGVTHVTREHARRRRAPAPIADCEADPEERMIAREGGERLAAAIRSLPLSYRQPITLVLEGLSYAEIAEALGIGISNVGVRVNRAKTRLKELLGE